MHKATGRVHITGSSPLLWYKVGEEFDVYNLDVNFFAVANVDMELKIHKLDCTLVDMVVLKDMKFRIHDDEHSELIQKHLFSQGVHWTGTSGQTVAYTHLPYLIIGPRGWLEYTDSEDTFNELKAVEYTLQTETTIKHKLIPVTPSKTVLIDGVEVDEDVIKAALAHYKVK